MSDPTEGLKIALRKFPAAVNVIALRLGDGRFFGITATAVTVMTMLPPTMIVCINRESAFGQVLESAQTFSINVLGQEQVDVSNANSGGLAQAEREFVGTWGGDSGTPILDGAQANIICTKRELQVVGTHYLVLGEVIEVRSADTVSPLIYLDRSYGHFLPNQA